MLTLITGSGLYPGLVHATAGSWIRMLRGCGWKDSTTVPRAALHNTRGHVARLQPLPKSFLRTGVLETLIQTRTRDHGVRNEMGVEKQMAQVQQEVHLYPHNRSTIIASMSHCS